MTNPWLITQCLQNDFVAPIGRYDTLPNLLHIGAEESRRLMGDGSTEGPVGRVLRWAYQQPDDTLRLVHIRDWHDPSDPQQAPHLQQFGNHCLRGSAGAGFAFAEPHGHGKDVAVIDSVTLNDFLGTPLQDILTRHPTSQQQFGLMGVWTEAKISFLAYELRSRFPEADIAVCSALTASSSRSRHFLALEQLRQILGVRLIDSVGEFIEFLGGAATPMALPARSSQLTVTLDGPALPPEDEALLRYVFRDCRSVRCRALRGGFSGSRVLACESEDIEHRQQAPCVLKMGERQPIATERMAFEQIEAVLGNAAPSIDDHADFGTRGAIKYRYASMDSASPTTIQKLYQTGMPAEEFNRLLDVLFGEQLMRLYTAAERDPLDLLDHYGFSSELAASVRQSIEAMGIDPSGPTVDIAPGKTLANPVRFYAEVLPRLTRQAGRSWWQSWGHGDLNGANVVVDSRQNVWVIDFSHAGRGHVLRDLTKFENDLLYIWTRCEDEADFAAGWQVLERLYAVEDLGLPLSTGDEMGITHPAWHRTWQVVRHLRSFYPALVRMDRDPLQLLIAQTRYAAHTLSFEECNPWQKRLALAATAIGTQAISDRMAAPSTLRVDWLPSPHNQIGITLLPGRRDYQRVLNDDFATLKSLGVTHVLSLITRGELELHGVPELIESIQREGLVSLWLEIDDQKAATRVQFEAAFQMMDAALQSSGKVVIHCLGGLGRSGMVAAGYLASRHQLPGNQAIETIRTTRSARAIETTAQEVAVLSCQRTMAL